MATDAYTRLSIPLAAAVLLWPAVWNGYPIVFADTGTYLSQAIHLYLGWDRPVFYSLALFVLHWKIALWPAIVAQALLAAWVLALTLRALSLDRRLLPPLALGLSLLSWLPWLVCEIMPDSFTPLLALTLCLLALNHGGVPLILLTAFMISSQQSSLPIALTLIVALLIHRRTAWRRLLLPPILAAAALLAVNLIGHGRASLSPYGNVFLLARVIYDGPGMTVLRRDCPQAGWRLCPFLDRFPPTSDEFLWRADSPILLAGGHKAVSADAGAILSAALTAYPWTQARAVIANALEQLGRFRGGDGLEAWPNEVSPWIARDFPRREAAAYAAARQQSGTLTLPTPLADLHDAVSILGIVICLLLLPRSLRRRDALAPFLFVSLIILPVSAVVTGGLSTPHDRYQSRIMWLPPCIAVLGLVMPRPPRR